MSRARSEELQTYAGLWVALVRGRVVASGDCAQDALTHCRAMRLKDEPTLRFVPQRQSVVKRQTAMKYGRASGAKK